LIFKEGIPTFSNENENEASGIFWGVSQDLFFMHRAYGSLAQTNGCKTHVTLQCIEQSIEPGIHNIFGR